MTRTALDAAKQVVEELEELRKRATPVPWEAPLKDLGKVESFAAVDFYFDHSFEAYPPLGESGPVFVANSAENAAMLTALANNAPALLRIARAVIEFKCPTCRDRDPFSWGSRDSHKTGCPYRDGEERCDCGTRHVPCPTCTPLMSALEGLTK